METLKESCIIHWKRLHDNAPEAWQTRREATHSRWCPYCAAYEDDCKECPIGIKTGKEDCDGTPYADANDAWAKYKRSGWNKVHKAAWQKAAMAMIQFLE